MPDSIPTIPIKLIVGLGNPGAKYDQTRHNAGQDWLVQLAKEEGINLAIEKRFFGDYGQGFIAGHKVHLLIPNTFMNLSGGDFFSFPLSSSKNNNLIRIVISTCKLNKRHF